MIKRTVLGVALASLFLAAPSFAQEKRIDRPEKRIDRVEKRSVAKRKHARRKEVRRDLRKRADRNEDGKLGPGERRRLREKAQSRHLHRHVRKEHRDRRQDRRRARLDRARR